MPAAEPWPIPEGAIEERFLAATGPGGQNVNKAAPPVRLRLDVFALGLDPATYQRLKTLAGSRFTDEGAVIVTARRFRTREANRADARERIGELLRRAHERPTKRVKTKPSRAAKQKRLEGKSIRSDVKRGRGRVKMD